MLPIAFIPPFDDPRGFAFRRHYRFHLCTVDLLLKDCFLPRSPALRSCDQRVHLTVCEGKQKLILHIKEPVS